MLCVVVVLVVVVGVGRCSGQNCHVIVADVVAMVTARAGVVVTGVVVHPASRHLKNQRNLMIKNLKQKQQARELISARNT